MCGVVRWSEREWHSRCKNPKPSHTYTCTKEWERGWRIKSFHRCTRESEEAERVIVRYCNTSTEGRYERESEEGEEDELELEENKEGPCWGGRGVYPSVDLDGTLLMWNIISCQLCGNVCQMPCDVYLWLSACLHVHFLICIHLHSPVIALHWFLRWMCHDLQWRISEYWFDIVLCDI